MDMAVKLEANVSLDHFNEIIKSYDGAILDCVLNSFEASAEDKRNALYLSMLLESFYHMWSEAEDFGDIMEDLKKALDEGAVPAPED